MTLTALSNRWTQVFHGPHALADLHAQELRARGIEAFTPDSYVKVLDPSIAGGSIFDKGVLVLRERADEAREALRFVGANRDDSTEPASEDELRAVALRRLRNRIFACAMLWFLAPYGLWLAVRYFRAARGEPRANVSYASTTAATVVCALWVTGFVVAFVLRNRA
jgi:hypothetical protein